MPKKTGMDRHIELRKELEDVDMNITELAIRIGRSSGYVSNCIRGKQSWRLEDCYKIIEVIGKSIMDIARLFPPEGIEQKIEVSSKVEAVDTSLRGPINTGAIKLKENGEFRITILVGK